MIKKNLPMLIITSIVILIPILIGFLLWNSLPDQVAIHWNAQGEVDGYADKLYAVIVMPLFMLVLHWVCMLITCSDPKQKNISDKPLTLVLWICPLMSLLVGAMIYVTELGLPVSVEIIIPLVMGVLFVVVGNYMPKCKQNYSIGIKVIWALNDEENWNKTHRFAGFIWVAGGILIMALSFLGSIWLFLAITLILAFAPMIYSFCLYKKKKD